MIIKELKVDIPDWCNGCQSFELVQEKGPNGQKIFTCENYDYCRKAKRAYEQSLPSCPIKQCRDCTINIYPTQTKFVEVEHD